MFTNCTLLKVALVWEGQLRFFLRMHREAASGLAEPDPKNLDRMTWSLFT